MSEIQTESFCERCGTRYTFESARPKIRLKGVKVLSRGLKNFVLSDDTTMDEAMAAARSETDRELTAHQLDAFHKTFNFCMSCRQYTCPNCWNEVEARCQSCAPLPEQVAAPVAIEPISFPGLMTLAQTVVTAEPAANGANGHDHDAMAADGAAAEAAAIGVGSEADATGREAATAVDAPIEPAAKATSQTAGLLARFRPGQNLDDELAAFERERSGADAQPAALSAGAEALETAEEAATEQPVEAAAAGHPVETLSADLAAAARTEAEPAAQPAADVVEQPTWRITAPDVDAAPPVMPPHGDRTKPLQANGPSLPAAEPQWPAKPEWPAPQASAGLPFLGRPAQPQGGVEALWAASNRELVTTPPAPGRSTTGIQPCISCGLSLSANARFCRRCGTLQGG